ncbi:MAG: hypothetical protein IKH53_10665, partial [Muribaculaceae bacterium]|nr:hypothetical protein [Muribaculaceae bacterium]
MKKSIFTFCLAVMAVVALHAESYSGNIVVSYDGQVYNADVTVTVTPEADGLNTFSLEVPILGTLVMNDVHCDTQGGVTVYSAQRDVDVVYNSSTIVMNTILFARTVDGMMAANVSIPAYGIDLWFNTVGNHFQLPNSDMEAWTNS